MADADKPQVGDKYRVYFGKDHFANRLLRVRAIVDDDYVVVRFWKRKRWMYELTSIWYFEGEHVTKVKSDKTDSSS